MGIAYFLIISIIAAKRRLACFSSFFYKSLGVYAIIIVLSNCGRWSRYTEMYSNPSIGEFLATSFIGAIGGLVAYFVFYLVFSLLFRVFGGSSKKRTRAEFDSGDDVKSGSGYYKKES